ncbi:hypothetical protein VHUM_01560 [Vanrija humicola]|uniref:Nodulin-like domain-containing protein n=1 Tax=Vanrija humicola TaxID=5417 RepID=A0A7D8V3D2_VANHU|nr:hypothetical protein VHUM_01560 [Vanrija humicola]
MCLSIAMSAVQANGVYCWSTYGPVVSKTLGLNGTQSQTIVVGGILGVYLCAAPVGALTDHYGPRAGSLLSALLGAAGYFTFAKVLEASDDAAPNAYLILTACYFAVGAATVGSYFSALTTASLSFPAYPTLALSLPLALIGLSPSFLSSFSPWFTLPGGELDAVHYIAFLGLLSLGVNLFGALFMRVTLPELPIIDDADSIDSDFHYGYGPAEAAADLSASLHLDERTPLLIGGVEAAREEVEAEMSGKEVKWSTVRLIKNPGFWAFGGILTLCIGPSEMIIATIGTILTSLLPPEQLLALKQFFAQTMGHPLLSVSTLASAAESSALELRNKHVFILSMCSTVGRLLTGFAADRLSPAPVAVPAPASDEPGAPSHYFVQRDPIILSRSAFCSICTVGLGAVLAWSAAFLKDEPHFWVLSAGVGLLYGAIFTLTPAITSSHFGPTNFGLAWGLVSYFPALGAAIFSYTYSFLAVSNVQVSPDASVDQTLCYGAKCFSTTFYISAVGCVVSALGLFLLGQRWRV